MWCCCKNGYKFDDKTSNGLEVCGTYVNWWKYNPFTSKYFFHSQPYTRSI